MLFQTPSTCPSPVVPQICLPPTYALRRSTRDRSFTTLSVELPSFLPLATAQDALRVPLPPCLHLIPNSTPSAHYRRLCSHQPAIGFLSRFTLDPQSPPPRDVPLILGRLPSHLRLATLTRSNRAYPPRFTPRSCTPPHTSIPHPRPTTRVAKPQRTWPLYLPISIQHTSTQPPQPRTHRLALLSICRKHILPRPLLGHRRIPAGHPSGRPAGHVPYLARAPGCR
jgi:hypothetical protein